MGHDKLPHQISGCPLLPRHQELQTRIEIPSKLLQHRASCGTFKAVQDANVAAISAKTAAASTANPGEETGCQATTGFPLDFECAHSADEISAAALKACQVVLQEMPIDADAALKSVPTIRRLEGRMSHVVEEQVQAQSSLDSVESV